MDSQDHNEKYKIVSNPAIQSLVDELVSIRCQNDVTLQGPSRQSWIF